MEIYQTRDYFESLYGGKASDGLPAQTRFDIARDSLFRKLFEKYGDTPVAQAKVVDIGCGFGWLLDRFADAKSVCGMDISSVAVEVANKRKPDYDVRVGDLQDGLPFEQKFDLVLAVNVIEHLPEPDKGIAAIKSALRPGGIAVVHLPTIANRPMAWLYSKLYDSDPTHIYRPSGQVVNEKFEAAGFSVERSSYLPHIPARLTMALPLHPAFLAVYKLGE